MKALRTTLLIVIFLLPSGLFAAEKAAEIEKTARSNEGHQALVQLHQDVIKTFKSEKIRKRYLAARKLVQLNKDEINEKLLSAAIESMRCNNPHYKWFVAHFLQKISGEKHGIHLQAWRDWLSKDYVSDMLPVAMHCKLCKGKCKCSEGCKCGEHKEAKGKELKSKLITHEKPDAIKAIDAPASQNLTENTSRLLDKNDGVKTEEEKSKEAKGLGLGDTGVEAKKKKMLEDKVQSSDVKPSDANNSKSGDSNEVLDYDPKKQPNAP